MAFGIICEYNPFHNGHLHQINEIKKVSDEPIICVMSGNFTQRGEAAIVDKYARAEMALSAGADLVFELPMPYCVSSAEYFASAGVHILAGLGVDKLCFGSESADADKIIKIAEIACSPEFKSECAQLSKKEGSAAAYFDLLAERSGEKNILSNDILAIEYAKAIIKNGYGMRIYPIKREGSGYLDAALEDGKNPSATAIRETLRGGDLERVADFVPQSTLDILGGSELADIQRIKDGILLFLRLMDADRIDVAVADRGLVNRILSTAHECVGYDEFIAKLQTKKYTSAAIRRAIIYILLGIKRTDLEALPTHTVLLGANDRGRGHLNSIRKSDKVLRIITKPADAENCRQTELSRKADALYTMCFESKRECGCYFRKKPVIIT